MVNHIKLTSGAASMGENEGWMWPEASLHRIQKEWLMLHGAEATGRARDSRRTKTTGVQHKLGTGVAHSWWERVQREIKEN